MASGICGRSIRDFQGRPTPLFPVIFGAWDDCRMRRGRRMCRRHQFLVDWRMSISWPNSSTFVAVSPLQLFKAMRVRRMGHDLDIPSCPNSAVRHAWELQQQMTIGHWSCLPPCLVKFEDVFATAGKLIMNTATSHYTRPIRPSTPSAKMPRRLNDGDAAGSFLQRRI